MGLLKKEGNKLEIKMEKNSEWLIPLQMAEMQQNFGKVKKNNNWRIFLTTSLIIENWIRTTGEFF